MADLLGIGVSGLEAFQAALTTTGHNISNVNTPGYSRQTVNLTARTPQYTGAGFLGQGVDLTNVTRQYNGYLTNQVWTQTSSSNSASTYYNLASQVDNMLSDSTTGLTPALNSFFSAVQGVADNPTDTAARQTMLTSAQSLADNFNYMNGRLNDLNTQINTQVSSTVDDINSIAKNIAALNDQIVKEGSSGSPPNDLLDQRDELITKLSKDVSVQTTTTADGSMNVSIGTGQALVVGTTVTSLQVGTDNLDSSKDTVQMSNGTDVTSLLTGGTLGGLVDFRNKVLDPAKAKLGQVAAGLTNTINNQQNMGVDLNGSLGQNLFGTASIDNVAAMPNSNNTGNASVTTTVTDTSKLQASDYLLAYDGSNYTVTRQSDNTVVASSASLTGLNSTLSGQGFSVAIPSGSMNAGDQFLLKPVSGAAGTISVQMTDPSKIAAAAAIAGTAPTDANGNPTNLGSATISGVGISSPEGLPLSAGPGSLTLTYNSTTKSYSLPTGYSWKSGTSGAYDPTTDNGKTFSAQFTDASGNTQTISFQVTGTPQNNDTFTIADNTGSSAIGDNSNALAMAALNTQKTLGATGNGNPTASFNEGYAQLVSSVGTQTQQAKASNDAISTLLTQAQSAQQSVSGVNLDEEAANLVRYQQAYQAAAKVIATANTLFQSLLQSVG